MKRITLREARKRAKLTQVQLAAKSGIPQTNISKIELGTVVSPGFDTVLQLAAALEIDPRTLRFGHQPEAMAS